MPEVSQVALIHWCVVWQRVDTNTRYGQARVSSPVQMKCRWPGTTEQANVSQEVTQEQYTKSVFTGKEVKLGSYVWGPGKIADLPDEPTYYEVIAKEDTPDIKGVYYSHRVTLQKASKVLLEVVS